MRPGAAAGALSARLLPPCSAPTSPCSPPSPLSVRHRAPKAPSAHDLNGCSTRAGRIVGRNLEDDMPGSQPFFKVHSKFGPTITPARPLRERVKMTVQAASLPGTPRRASTGAPASFHHANSGIVTPKEPAESLFVRRADRETARTARTQRTLHARVLQAEDHEPEAHIAVQESAIGVSRPTTKTCCQFSPVPGQPGQSSGPWTSGEAQPLGEIARQAELLKLQFMRKNEQKQGSYARIFLEADGNKMGSLGRDELMSAFKRVGPSADGSVVNHMLATGATDKERLTFNDFANMFNPPGNMFILKPSPKSKRTHNPHLWLPTKPEVIGCPTFGTINDTMEADRRDDGVQTERLDGNFSGVQYNIVNFDPHGTRPIPPTTVVPVKKRDTLFDSTEARGRRAAYEHGDTPWNVTSNRTPRANRRTTVHGVGVLDESLGAESWRRQTLTTNLPVRVHTFARIYHGEVPSQGSLALGVMTPVSV